MGRVLVRGIRIVVRAAAFACCLAPCATFAEEPVGQLPELSTAVPDEVTSEPKQPVDSEIPVTLAPISVTATRSTPAVADPSAALTVLDSEQLEHSAARTLDDVLRRVPGFSLFRRLGSGAAHPTTQGVSLRGIGASGTSRALVLVDGVPLNDPFGGWVYWSRIPGETVERVEVLRGSGASLWGNYAMGGVIGVVTRTPARNAGGLLAEGGERGGARVSGWTSRRFGNTSAIVDAQWMESGDYPLVSDGTRGPIDMSGGSGNGGGGLRVEHELSQSTRVRMVARGFHEERDNGTPYTGNETTAGFFRVGLDRDTALAGSVSADLFSNIQTFQSTFSAVNESRSSESPAANQYDVPSQSVGGSLVWSGDPVQHHHLAMGLDALWVSGETKEFGRYMDGVFTRRREGGAEQAMGGLFVEDIFSLTERLDVTSALRFDYWESFDGFRRESELGTGTELVDLNLKSRREAIVSPRLGLAYEAADWLSLRTAAYRGFRAPTINEQVRPFRVRNDITEANAGLDAEKLLGVDVGFDQQLGRWSSSATFFWNQIDDPVFNVTVGEGGGVVPPCGFVPAGGVCRQRRNLGSTQIVGVESSTSVDFGHGFLATMAYLWSHGEVHSAPQAPDLIGNRIPQVPEHQGTIGFDYNDGGPWKASMQIRVVGQQFDDDTNSRSLGRFAAVDAFVARELGGGFEVFVAAENLFDETVETGKTSDGVLSIGAPRLVRAGIRFSFDADQVP